MEKGSMDNRKAGILMPISSLPSTEGIGTLGKGAYAFVDWLKRAGMRIWQVLPLLPTGYGDSPYQACAADALNHYFIDLETLVEEGLLRAEDYNDVVWSDDVHRVRYGNLFIHKTRILEKAFANFDKSTQTWQEFLSQKRYEDYGTFMALKATFNYRPWREWDEPYKSCDERAVADFQANHKEEIEFWQFTQYVFLLQWQKLKMYAHENGIALMGDMPIYIADDSVECWKYRKDLFMLDNEGNLALLAGVPPDAFSEDGQFWGNPVYNWAKMHENGYAWWKDRIRYAFSLFDCVRIDHFRAFDRFYAIPADAETAKEGEWLDGPKSGLFEEFPSGIIAEDLGTIDEGVRTLLEETGYPGMKVFEFAFNGDPENEYLPTLYNENCVAYTGTHDNDTLRAFLEDMPQDEREEFETTLEEQCLELDVPYVTETIETECKSIIELLFASKADTIIIPMHDVLVLGKEARLNTPSTLSEDNWSYRYEEKDFKFGLAAWLNELTETYNR